MTSVIANTPTAPRTIKFQRFIFDLALSNVFSLSHFTVHARLTVFLYAARAALIQLSMTYLFRSAISKVRVVFSVTLGTGSIRVGGNCAGLAASFSAFLRFDSRSVGDW